MDETAFAAVLAALILASFFESGFSLLGAAALIPLASKIPHPI